VLAVKVVAVVVAQELLVVLAVLQLHRLAAMAVLV
jgi:hypothetical protein